MQLTWIDFTLVGIVIIIVFMMGFLVGRLFQLHKEKVYLHEEINNLLEIKKKMGVKE